MADMLNEYKTHLRGYLASLGKSLDEITDPSEAMRTSFYSGVAAKVREERGPENVMPTLRELFPKLEM